MDLAPVKSTTNGIERTYSCFNWNFVTNTSHILNSKCTAPVVCNPSRKRFLDANPSSHEEGTPKKTSEEVNHRKQQLYDQQSLCNFCKYDLILEMAHLPDMTYSNNFLRLQHSSSGLVLEFSVLDALTPVIVKGIGLPHGMKVSPSEAWLRARMDCEYTRNVKNGAFDWTFSSDYQGSFRLATGTGPLVDLHEDQQPLQSLIEQNCSERINLDKLKQRNPIEFFDEIELFEDELADHGVANCSVKIRVMSDCFFVLLRYFLRVDNVFVRYFDTRYYHEFNKSYIIREFTNRESAIADLPADISPALFINPTELYSQIPQKFIEVDKINLPNTLIRL